MSQTKTPYLMVFNTSISLISSTSIFNGFAEITIKSDNFPTVKVPFVLSSKCKKALQYVIAFSAS